MDWPGWENLDRKEVNLKIIRIMAFLERKEVSWSILHAINKRGTLKSRLLYLRLSIIINISWRFSVRKLTLSTWFLIKNIPIFSCLHCFWHRWHCTVNAIEFCWLERCIARSIQIPLYALSRWELIHLPVHLSPFWFLTCVLRTVPKTGLLQIETLLQKSGIDLSADCWNLWMQGF